MLQWLSFYHFAFFAIWYKFLKIILLEQRTSTLFNFKHCIVCSLWFIEFPAEKYKNSCFLVIFPKNMFSNLNIYNYDCFFFLFLIFFLLIMSKIQYFKVICIYCSVIYLLIYFVHILKLLCFFLFIFYYLLIQG